MSRWAPWTLALLLLLVPSRRAAAEFDWPVQAELPIHDVALGFSGGVTFGQSGERSNLAGIGGLEFSYLHGVFGAHLSLAAYPERTGLRLQPLMELSFWYVAMLGAGLSVSPLLGERPEDVEETVVTFHVLIGIPIPLWRDGSEDAAGTFCLIPFARPGLRIQEAGEVEEQHTLGLMLKWTSYAF